MSVSLQYLLDDSPARHQFSFSLGLFFQTFTLRDQNNKATTLFYKKDLSSSAFARFASEDQKARAILFFQDEVGSDGKLKLFTLFIQTETLLVELQW